MEQIRVVALLPDQDQVCRGHEAGDKGAPCRRTREGIGADAEPAGVIGARVVPPELLFLHRLRVRKESAPRLDAALLHLGKSTVRVGASSGTL
jgi:hypothetical protein